MDGVVVAIAEKGSSWTGAALAECATRRALARLGASVVAMWNESVRYVVVPRPVRTKLWVCGAGAGCFFVGPAWVAAGCVGEDVGEEEVDGVRLWTGAPKFWRTVGRPLRGQRLEIVGEVGPRGSGAARSADVALMVEAAGGEVVDEGATIAIVAVGREEDARVREFVAEGVLCLGAAFVPDLIARAWVMMSEYVVVDEQRALVVDEVTRADYERLGAGEAMAFTKARVVEEADGAGVEEGFCEVEEVVKTPRRSERRKKRRSILSGGLVERKGVVRRAADDGREAVGEERSGAAVLRLPLRPAKRLRTQCAPLSANGDGKGAARTASGSGEDAPLSASGSGEGAPLAATRDSEGAREEEEAGASNNVLPVGDSSPRAAADSLDVDVLIEEKTGGEPCVKKVNERGMMDDTDHPGLVDVDQSPPTLPDPVVVTFGLDRTSAGQRGEADALLSASRNAVASGCDVLASSARLIAVPSESRVVSGRTAGSTIGSGKENVCSTDRGDSADCVEIVNVSSADKKVKKGALSSSLIQYSPCENGSSARQQNSVISPATLPSGRPANKDALPNVATSASAAMEKKRRRPPVIRESPPSEEDDDDNVEELGRPVSRRRASSHSSDPSVVGGANRAASASLPLSSPALAHAATASSPPRTPRPSGCPSRLASSSPADGCVGAFSTGHGGTRDLQRPRLRLRTPLSQAPARGGKKSRSLSVVDASERAVPDLGNDRAEAEPVIELHSDKEPDFGRNEDEASVYESRSGAIGTETVDVGEVCGLFSGHQDFVISDPLDVKRLLSSFRAAEEKTARENVPLVVLEDSDGDADGLVQENVGVPMTAIDVANSGLNRHVSQGNAGSCVTGAAQHYAPGKLPFEIPKANFPLQRLVSSRKCVLDYSGDRSEGFSMDDSFVESEVAGKYWALCSDRTSGLVGMRERGDFGTLARSAWRALGRSCILRNLLALKQPVDTTVRDYSVISAICSRMMGVDPPHDVLDSVVLELLDIRYDQQRSGDRKDSILVLLESAGHPLVNHRHRASLVLWLEVMQKCASLSSSPDGFWIAFNKAMATFRSKNFSTSGKRKWADPLAVDVVETRATIQQGVGRLSDWEQWCFESLAAVGSLYAASLVDPTESSVLACSSSPNFQPNWALVITTFDEFSKDAAASRQLANSSGSSFTSASPARLLELLRGVALDFAICMWHVTEDVMLSAVTLVQSYYTERDEKCLCVKVPSFLLNLRYEDVRTRKQFLSAELKTPCDCLALLSWLATAQSPSLSHTPRKLAGKIHRESSQFFPPGEHGGFCHSLTLILSVADAIAPPSDLSSCEMNLKRMLLSHLPSVPDARQLPDSFGSDGRECWKFALDAIVFRSKRLMSSGRDFSYYVEFIAKSFGDVSQRLKVSLDKVYASDEAQRQTARIHQGHLRELAGALLKAVATLIEEQDDRFQAESYSGSISMESNVQGVLLAAADLVEASGNMLQRIIAQLSSPLRETNAPIAGNDLLVSILSTLDTLIKHGISTRTQCISDLRGLDAVAKALYAAPLSSVADLVGQGGVLGSASRDLNVRSLAASILARIVGLCSLHGLFDSGSEQYTWTVLEVVSQAGMAISSFTPPAPKPVPTRAPSGKPSFSQTRATGKPSFSQARAPGKPPLSQARAEQQSVPILHANSAVCLLSTRTGRVIVAEFWSILVDPLWVAAVFDRSPSLDGMVIAAWIVLMSAPEAVARPSPLVKLAWSLKAVCRSRVVISSFFRKTLLHDRLVESDPRLHDVVVELRPQTVHDALAVVSKPGFYTPRNLRLFLLLLSSVIAYEDLGAGDPAWKRDQSTDNGRALSPPHCLRLHQSFAAYGSALIFAVRSAMRQQLSVPISASSRPFLVEAAKVLEEGRDSLSSLSNALGRLHPAGSPGGADNGSPAFESLCSRICALVYHGLSCLGCESGAFELRKEVSRFSMLMGRVSFGSLAIPLAHCDLAPWIKRLGLFSAAYQDASAQAALDRGRAKSVQSWRSTIFNIILTIPLQRNPFQSSYHHSFADYRSTLGLLTKLLEVHLSYGSEALAVEEDASEVLVLVIRNLRSAEDKVLRTVSKECVDTIDACIELGCFIEGTYMPLVAKDQAAKRLVSLAIELVNTTAGT